MTNPVRKAVVPAAGLGTRHFPASHAVKKELFPVVGPDGIARALLHYHLLELTAAGIEEICIIVQPGDDKPIRDYLVGPDHSYLSRLAKYPVPRLWDMYRSLEKRSAPPKSKSAAKPKAAAAPQKKPSGDKPKKAASKKS